MIRENKIYAGLLAVLLVLSYLSWHRAPDEPGTSKVTLLDARPESLRKVELHSPTSTVTVELRGEGEDRYAWIEVLRGKRSKRFVGNRALNDAAKGYAKLEAARSLGTVKDDRLAETGLDAPKTTLRIVLGQDERVFEVGGRTSGARDYYVRPEGGAEVFLLPSHLINDLERPEGRFMQRRLREAPLEDVVRLRIEAEERSTEVLHENRFSPRDAFWATPDKPDTVSDILGNYVDKLERLTATEYLDDPERFEAATPVLSAVWIDEDGEVLDRLEIRKSGEGDDVEYYGRSRATRVPARLVRFNAQQLESDLSLVLGG